MASSKIVFLVVPEVHILDLAGPLQALFEANGFGAGYRLTFAAATSTIKTAQGIRLSGLEPYPDVSAGDMVLVPGMESKTLDQLDDDPHEWLNRAHESGATIGSICSGAFVLARAGLLDGRACTTHWKLTDRLQAECPRSQVHRNRLFVEDRNIITSAGVSSGIDMALAVIERPTVP